MKTKELIELLQREDPTGNGNLVINGVGILNTYVAVEACYYDGKPILPRYEDGKLVGAVKTSNGYKVVLQTLDAESEFMDALLDRCEVFEYTSDDRDFTNQTYVETVGTRLRWLQEAKRDLFAQVSYNDGEPSYVYTDRDAKLALAKRTETELVRDCEKVLQEHLQRWVPSERARGAFTEIRRKLSLLSLPVPTGIIAGGGNGYWVLNTPNYAYPEYKVNADGEAFIRKDHRGVYETLDPYAHDFKDIEELYTKRYADYVARSH